MVVTEPTTSKISHLRENKSGKKTKKNVGQKEKSIESAPFLVAFSLTGCQLNLSFINVFDMYFLKMLTSSKVLDS